MLVAGVAWAYVPVSALTAQVPAAHRSLAQPNLPWLSVDGHERIVDDQGRTVLLRGFNSDALLEPSVRHATLDETDATLMQRAGFDVVRLPVAWSRLEPERGHIDVGYLDEIATAVAMLNRHGMYAVLDMHFLDWGPRFGGSGAPQWAALPVVPDLQWWPWESFRKHVSPAQNAATTYFWLSPDWQADFTLAWRSLAQRFRDDSGVAGYDLYNEPHPLPLPPRLFEEHWLWPLYARTIEAIGDVDANHLFIVEGILFGDYGTTVVPLSAPDLVYSPHIYTGSLVPPAFTGDRSAINHRIADQAAEARDVPAPMWPGELGIDHHQAHAAEWADAFLDAYDDLRAGWAWWQWRESSGWGIRDASGTQLDLDYLRHLARPYLAVAPDWVSSGRGDGLRGRLSLHVAPEHGVASVSVAWPQLTVGPPRAAGGCVLTQSWDEVTARLTLSLGPGTCTVVIAAA
jgi:endoglycosylceramidase